MCDLQRINFIWNKKGKQNFVIFSVFRRVRINKWKFGYSESKTFLSFYDIVASDFPAFYVIPVNSIDAFIVLLNSCLIFFLTSLL